MLYNIMPTKGDITREKRKNNFIFIPRKKFFI